LFDKVQDLSIESVVTVTGRVRARPDEMRNKEMDTGAVEVEITDLQVLNPADPLPFPIAEKARVSNEALRLKHRYLDLRRSQMLQNVRARSQAAQVTRGYFLENGFLEVETPTLFKHTPEGAREYIVPTREAGRFYALAQSPQQYKQLLMAGGIDRYFQLARCYRDEDLRSDRQPEFTQIDLEMSFVTQADVQRMVQGLVRRLWREVKGVEVPGTFPHLNYRDAISRYGSDKPDTRYGLEIHNVSAHFGSGSQVSPVAEALRRVVVGGGHVEVICVPGGASTLASKDLRQVEELLVELGLKDGLRVAKVLEGGEWSKPLALETPAVRASVNAATQAAPGDLLIFLASVPLVNVRGFFLLSLVVINKTLL